MRKWVIATITLSLILLNPLASMSSRFKTVKRFPLPERLRQIVQPILEIARTNPNLEVADIGADHGLLACYLSQYVKKVYAIDASAKAIEYCKRNVVKHGLENKIAVIHGHGLIPFQTHQQYQIPIVVLAGIGAENVIRTLSDHSFKKLSTTTTCTLDHTILSALGIQKMIIQTWPSDLLEVLMMFRIILASSSHTVFESQNICGTSLETNQLINPHNQYLHYLGTPLLSTMNSLNRLPSLSHSNNNNNNNNNSSQTKNNYGRYRKEDTYKLTSVIHYQPPSTSISTSSSIHPSKLFTDYQSSSSLTTTATTTPLLRHISLVDIFRTLPLVKNFPFYSTWTQQLIFGYFHKEYKNLEYKLKYSSTSSSSSKQSQSKQQQQQQAQLEDDRNQQHYQREEMEALLFELEQFLKQCQVILSSSFPSTPPPHTRSDSSR
jgi:precorrin-6B methylase 2